MARLETATGGRPATTGVIRGGFSLSVGDPGTEPPSRFRWRLLTDVARLESGHTPSRRVQSYWGGSVPWVGIRDATGNHGRTIFSTKQYITEEGLANSSARLLPADTVCLSRTASVGYVVTMGVPMATSQDFLNWVCGSELHPKYLHYILLSEQESIRHFAHGTTHQTVYYPEAKAFHVCMPARPEQDAIVRLLSALDDKIAINEQVARACHDLAQAQTIRAIADVSTVPLSDLAVITMGSSPPGETYNEASIGIPFYQGSRDFGSRFPIRRVWCSRPIRIAPQGATLISVRAPVGRLNIATEESCIGRGVGALVSKTRTPSVLFHILIAKPEVWTPFDSEGTVFGAINKDQIGLVRIPSVSNKSAQLLEDALEPLDEQVKLAFLENVTLAELRDTLLPKLMSGELRVWDAEKVVEEAT